MRIFGKIKFFENTFYTRTKRTSSIWVWVQSKKSCWPKRTVLDWRRPRWWWLVSPVAGDLVLLEKSCQQIKMDECGRIVCIVVVIIVWETSPYTHYYDRLYLIQAKWNKTRTETHSSLEIYSASQVAHNSWQRCCYFIKYAGLYCIYLLLFFVFVFSKRI